MDRDWTDKRMDDFAARVDRLEANVGQRFARFEADVDRRFDKVDRRFDRLEAETRTGFARAAEEARAASAKLDARLGAMNRTIWGAIIAAALVNFLFN